MYNSINLHPKIFQTLYRQKQQLIKAPPKGITYVGDDNNSKTIEASIIGPDATPYEGGLFKIRLTLTEDFPRLPPRGTFLTKIFHPNVSLKGEICVDTLKKEWNSKAWSLAHIFSVVRCLLIIPFPQSSLNDEAGKLFMHEYKEYCKRARISTQIHASSWSRKMGIKPGFLSKENWKINQSDLLAKKGSNSKGILSNSNRNSKRILESESLKKQKMKKKMKNKWIKRI